MHIARDANTELFTYGFIELLNEHGDLVMHLNVESVLFASSLLNGMRGCEAIVSREFDFFSRGERLPIAVGRANLGRIVDDSRCSHVVKVVLDADAWELL